MRITILAVAAAALLCAVPATHASAQTSPPGPLPDAEYYITGAGASFPFPLLDLWRVKIGEAYDNFSVNYQSIGSGGGIKQHIEETVAFAGTDAPLTVNEYKAVKPTLHIPESIGAVNVVYSVDGLSDGLNLTGKTIADIFEGKITKWDDPAIAASNPGVKLPAERITVVSRSDGSGTTKVFTQWLSSVSSSWDENVGSGKSVSWPVGIGSPGNEGVAGTMLTTPNSIAYVSIAYATQNDIDSAAIENGDKTNYVYPTLKSTADAADELARVDLPAAHEPWHGVNLLNAPGDGSYPIATFTYLLVYEEVAPVTASQKEAAGLVWMVDWMITEGQQYASDLGFVPLPDEVVKIGKTGLGRVTYDGSQIWEYVPEVSLIPDWVKQIFVFYANDQISEAELIAALEYLIGAGIIKV